MIVLESVFGFSEPVGTFSTTNRYLVMKIITCQHEWVEQCQLRYKVEPPIGYHFEDAHYPEPKCRNGIDTVRLWYPDHIVHGALQTLNLQHPCVHGYRVSNEREILQKIYPEYLPIYEEAYILCQQYAAKKAHEAYPDMARKNGVALNNRPDAMKSRSKGGKKGSQRQRELHPDLMRENGLKTHELHPNLLSENAFKVNKQRWQCTVTGYISTPAGLSNYQIKRNIDTSNRIKLN